MKDRKSPDGVCKEEAGAQPLLSQHCPSFQDTAATSLSPPLLLGSDELVSPVDRNGTFQSPVPNSTPTTSGVGKLLWVSGFEDGKAEIPALLTSMGLRKKCA